MSRLLGCMLLSLFTVAQADEASCPPSKGVVLQVLGSGGPIADDDRASAGYLVWADGRAKALIDAGGGVFLRFGQSGAKFEDLDLVALSHFHTDHSADLPALLKSGNFSGRTRPLTISGPSGNSRFPALEGFLDGLLDESGGAFKYLSGYLDGTGGLARLHRVEIDYRDTEQQSFATLSGMEVKALTVPHGIVPSIAYRIEIGGKSLVFASDQNGGAENFPEFAQGADLLIAHFAIPESATGAAVKLHARPSDIARMARESNAKTLVLSHFMNRSLKGLDESLSMIKNSFAGRVFAARDLDCLIP